MEAQTFKKISQRLLGRKTPVFLDIGPLSAFLSAKEKRKSFLSFFWKNNSIFNIYP
jgi:hypothetical protein